jgi:hypothetical protein
MENTLMDSTETTTEQPAKMGWLTWIRWTVFPFVSLKTHVNTMDAYDRVIDEGYEANELLVAQLAEAIDTIDALEAQVSDLSAKLPEPPLENWTVPNEVPKRVILDHDDEAIARMEHDGYIDPMIWGHPGKD